MARKYDWLSIKGEFMVSPHITLASFFQETYPEITNNTYTPRTAGWLDEKREMQLQALDRIKDKRVKALELKAKRGAVVAEKGFKYLEREDVQPKNIKEASEMFKLGSDVESEALGIDAESAKRLNNPIVNVQVNNDNRTQQINGLTIDQLARLADALAGTAKRTFEGEFVSLGDQDNREGGRKAV